MVFFFLFSCETATEKRDQDRLAASARKNEVTRRLMSHYKAVAIFDSSESSLDEVQYTYVYQRMLINEKAPLAFQGYIDDIIQSDSGYILKLGQSLPLLSYRHVIAEVTLTNDEFAAFESKIPSTTKGFFYVMNVSGCFIVRVDSFRTASILEHDSETGDVYVEEDVVKISGRLIDYQLYEKEQSGMIGLR